MKVELQLASYGKQAQQLVDQGEVKGSINFVALSTAADIISKGHQAAYEDWVIPKVVYDLRLLAAQEPEALNQEQKIVLGVLVTLTGAVLLGSVVGFAGVGYHFVMYLFHIGR